MGERAKSKTPQHRSEVLHRRQLFGGRMTAEEVHRKYAWGGRRCLCGQPPVERIKVFMPKDELLQRAPNVAAAIMATNPDGPYIPVLDTKYGPMVLVSSVYPCRDCKVTAEKEAAKGPSWTLVEIDRGPGPDGATSQVPVTLKAPTPIISPAEGLVGRAN